MVSIKDIEVRLAIGELEALAVAWVYDEGTRRDTENKAYNIINQQRDYTGMLKDFYNEAKRKQQNYEQRMQR